MPHNLNVSFNYVEGESLIMAIKELAVSSGSACAAGSDEPSHVLSAIGFDADTARTAVRFSFSHNTTEEDLSHAASALAEAISTVGDTDKIA